MNEVTLSLGDLVKSKPSKTIGIVTRHYGNNLYAVLFPNGHTYTCFLQDLEVICT